MNERMSAAEFQRLFGGGVGREPAPASPQIRLPAKHEPNKTESRWAIEAARYWPGCRIDYEGVTLRLPSGTKYTPDFVVWSGATIVAMCEVKGAHIHNQRSIHAFKEARASYPDIDFHFCQWIKNQWAIAPGIKNR